MYTRSVTMDMIEDCDSDGGVMLDLELGRRVSA